MSEKENTVNLHTKGSLLDEKAKLRNISIQIEEENGVFCKKKEICIS